MFSQFLWAPWNVPVTTVSNFQPPGPLYIQSVPGHFRLALTSGVQAFLLLTPSEPDSLCETELL